MKNVFAFSYYFFLLLSQLVLMFFYNLFPIGYICNQIVPMLSVVYMFPQKIDET